MQPNPSFGFEQIVTEVIRGVLEAVAEKPGLSQDRRASLTQTVVCSVMAFEPRDPVEAMMAGQCIVYDHLLRDGVREMQRGQADQVTARARPGVLAVGKVFLATMAMLLRMQRRPEAQLAFARQPLAREPAKTPNDAGETTPAPPTPRGVTATPARPAAPPDCLPVNGPVSPPSVVVPRETSSVVAAKLAPRPNLADHPSVPLAPNAPDRVSSGRRTDATVPPVIAGPPVMPRELIEEILFDSLDPTLRHETLPAPNQAKKQGIDALV